MCVYPSAILGWSEYFTHVWWNTYSILRISIPFDGITGHRMVQWCTFLWSNRPLLKIHALHVSELLLFSSHSRMAGQQWCMQVRRVILPFIGSLYRCGWSGRLSLSGILHTLQASVARMSKLHGDSMGTSKCVCNTHLLGELHASARGTEACSCHENFLK